VPRGTGGPQGRTSAALRAAACALARAAAVRAAVRPARPPAPHAAVRDAAGGRRGRRVVPVRAAGADRDDARAAARAGRSGRPDPPRGVPRRRRAAASAAARRADSGAVVRDGDGAARRALDGVPGGGRADGARRAAAGPRRRAVRLQGRRLRHLPGDGDRGRRADGPYVRPRRGGAGGRLRADLPGPSGHRAGRARLRSMRGRRQLWAVGSGEMPAQPAQPVAGAFVEPILAARTFEQAIEQIVEAIERSRLRVGERLPNESELAAQLAISKPTLRQALRVLERAGLIVVRRGAGGGIFLEEELVPIDLINSYVAAEEHQVVETLVARRVIEGGVARLAAVAA